MKLCVIVQDLMSGLCQKFVESQTAGGSRLSALWVLDTFGGQIIQSIWLKRKCLHVQNYFQQFTTVLLLIVCRDVTGKMLQ